MTTKNLWPLTSFGDSHNTNCHQTPKQLRRVYKHSYLELQYWLVTAWWRSQIAHRANLLIFVLKHAAFKELSSHLFLSLFILISAFYCSMFRQNLIVQGNIFPTKFLCLYDPWDASCIWQAGVLYFSKAVIQSSSNNDMTSRMTDWEGNDV